MNKLNLLIFSAFLSLWSTGLQAQLSNPQAYKGEVMPLRYSNSFNDLMFLTDDGSYIYALQRPHRFKSYNNVIAGMRTYTIAKYSIDELQLVEANPLDLSYEKGERNLEFTALIQDKVYVFSSFQDKGQKKILLFIEKLNLDELNTTSTLQKVAEIDYSKVKRYKRAEFDYAFSENASKLIVRYNLLNKRRSVKKERSLLRGYKVFTDDFEEIRTFQEPLPSEKLAFFDHSDFLVSNSGEILILGKQYKNKKIQEQITKAKRRYIVDGPMDLWRYPHFQFQAYHIDSKKEVKAYTFDHLDLQITDLVINESPEGRLIAAGFYADKNSMDVKGTLTAELDLPRTQLSNVQLNSLDLEFMISGLSKLDSLSLARAYHNSRRNHSRIHFDLNKLIFYKDGGYALIAQPNFIESVRGRFEIAPRRKYNYHYNDIWVLKHDDQGKLAWRTKVYRRQFYPDFKLQYYSYGMTFNDDIIRLNYNIGAWHWPVNEVYSAEESSLYSTLVYNDGEIKTRLIVPEGNDAGAFTTIDSMELKSGDVVFSAFDFNKYGLLILKK